MKVLLKYFVYVFVALLIVAGLGTGVYAYFGGFKSIEVEHVKCVGPYIAFKHYKGDYRKSYEAMREVQNFLKTEMKIDDSDMGTGIGVYFDVPGTIDVKDQRSVVGYTLTEEQYERFPANDKGIYKAKLGYTDVVYSEFPYKGKPSFIMAVFKIYPAFQKYLKENSISPNASVEIYDMEGRKIEVYIPVDMSYQSMEKALGA